MTLKYLQIWLHVGLITIFLGKIMSELKKIWDTILDYVLFSNTIF